MTVLPTRHRWAPAGRTLSVSRRSKFLAAIGAALSVAAGYYLAVQRTKGRQPDAPPKGPVRAPTRRERNVEVARLATTTGSSFAVHRARRVFASAGKRHELDAAFELQTAEQVADLLGNMKGALMKLGQMASYLDQGLPEPIRQSLAQLQQDAPPMTGELAAEVVERELGGPPDEVFEQWDPKPIAAASIGQVHRAITREGTAVAVKVQYPDVDTAIRADLDNAGMLLAATGFLFPGLDAAAVAEEFRARVLEELDYEIEATNQRLFVEYYRDHPFIAIPAVVDEYSTARVLTTELVEGARFDELATWDQAERDLAAEAVYRFVFGSLWRLHAFNGDPHPGNYLFRPGGRVTFLDFGLVKHFETADLDHLAAMLQAIVIDKDIPAFRRAVEAAGFMRDTRPFTDEQVVGYMGHFYEFIREDRPRTITPEWSSESIRRFFDVNGEHGEMIRAANVPRAFVVLQRINLGLFAVLVELRATANWRAISSEIWPWIQRPPSTPLGKAEAEWLATKNPDTGVR